MENNIENTETMEKKMQGLLNEIKDKLDILSTAEESVIINELFAEVENLLAKNENGPDEGIKEPELLTLYENVKKRIMDMNNKQVANEQAFEQAPEQASA